MKKFEAKAVSVMEDRELNTFFVILAEESDGDGSRLEIQKALSFDEQDKDNGMDTYCICTETGEACYGGIAFWDLSENRLEIKLESDAAEILGEEGYLVRFKSAYKKILQNGLLRILS